MDFCIPEHGRRFYSHKYKKSGLRYEVGLCILTGDIVWINGPYECGVWPDIKIFRNALMFELDDGERCVADDVYVGEHPDRIKCPKGFPNRDESKEMESYVRGRHETVNKRFKQFGALKQVWRHDIWSHGDAF